MLLRLTLLGIGLAASYVGSLCFQNGSVADMAVGGGAILIGILCFFFLAKGLWRFLGCMSTFILMAVLVGVLFFFVSGSDIIKNISAGITSAISGTDSTKEEEKEAPQQTVSQSFQIPAEAQPVAESQPPVGLPPEMLQMMQQAPSAPPSVVTGKISSIVSGDVFRMGQNTIRLYGLATPVIDQKCQDGTGHTYDCGYVAARMLKDFVSGDDVTCRVMNFNAQNELMAACSVGSFDIGAAMVEAGWAIALPAVSQIYLPYQQKAQEGKKGLWIGRFQMPWEWMAQQKQAQERPPAKLNIPSMPKVKKKGKSLLDFF